ncbi:MAG: hypothetical protein ABIY52_16115, partial [Gemmatimonadaceae bacterium]
HRLSDRELLAKRRYRAYVHRQPLAVAFAVIAIIVIAFAMIRSSANTSAPRQPTRQPTSPIESQ